MANNIGYSEEIFEININSKEGIFSAEIMEDIENFEFGYMTRDKKHHVIGTIKNSIIKEHFDLSVFNNEDL